MSPPDLPRLIVLTDRSQVPRGRRLLDVVAAGVEAGLRAVLVRERDLPAAERRATVREVARLLRPVGGVVVQAAPRVEPEGAGVHLRAHDPAPSCRPALLGRSCHDAAEVGRAASEGCDYVTLSPVASTPSKPGHGPPLGVPGVDEAARRHHVLVYALGGVTAANACDWLRAGAYGVAVMGAVMRADRPGDVVAQLLDRVATSEVVA